jgi:bacteriocin-like protein
MGDKPKDKSKDEGEAKRPNEAQGRTELNDEELDAVSGGAISRKVQRSGRNPQTGEK